MSEPTPPSIPPRERPTVPAASAGSATRVSSTATDVSPEPAPAAPPSIAPSGRPATSGSSTSTSRSAGSGRSVTSSPTGPVSAGASSAKRSTDSPTSSGKAPAAAKVSAASAASDSGARTTVGYLPDDARPDDELEDEGPSPLQVAVDQTTTWIKKTAGSVSAAISSATRPRPEDPAMTSTAAAPAPAPAPTETPAGTNSLGARPVTGRAPAAAPHGAPRRVRLAVSRIDPWSVMKLSFLLSVAIGIMIVVAAAIVWFTLNELNVFTQINDLILQITGTENPIPVLDYVEFDRVISAATLVAVVDVFLLTALSTIGAFLYNIVAALVGGIHLTLTDE